MRTVAGVFKTVHEAEGARQQMRLIGIDEARVTITSPKDYGLEPRDRPEPDDEFFLCTECLREGGTVLVAFVEDAPQAEAARDILRLSGAESLEVARDRWWSGLRGEEEEHYQGLGLNFQEDELTYRKGFQAALDPNIQGRTYYQALDYLEKHYPDVSQQSFRHGYERGARYYEIRKHQHQT